VALPREDLTGSDACELSARWGVTFDTMDRVVAAADLFFLETRQRVQIISGSRTRAEQVALGRSGRPTARDDLSTHRSCPATGVDVNLGFAPTRVQKAIWGRIAVMNGLRWGGGSNVDPGGIPSDWGHVDRGPRLG